MDSIILGLHSCIGQASSWSLRPCLSQPDKWLLIMGEKGKINGCFKNRTSRGALHSLEIAYEFFQNKRIYKDF